MNRLVQLCLLALIFLGCEKEVVIPTYKDQLAKDIMAIDKYLASAGITAEQDTTGLRYIILNAGSAFRPVLADSINVNFSFSLLSGESMKVNESNTLLLNKLIRAWRIILPSLGEGAKVNLFVPSGLAYGAYRTGPIPANSNLIFDIQLVKVIREFGPQLERDKIDIDAFLTASNITAIKDFSGLRYVITTQGLNTALTPLSADSVVVNFTGRILPSQVVFEPTVSKGFKISAGSTLRFWKSALPLFREGTKATIYVPSGLAYGAYGKTGVAPYTNLIYTIELVKVIRR